MFLGSPAFAVPSLQAIAADAGISIELVVTQPDRPAGRGRRLTSPPIADAARDIGLSVFQPESLRSDEALDVIEALKPDELVVVAYGELLNRRALRIAPHGALNVHPSLLPKYRGAAPIPAAILNGDEETGVSIMRLVRRLDAGPIVAQERVHIQPRATAGELGTQLATLAASLLPETCLAWAEGRITEQPQEDDLATYTREWSRADAQLDWHRSAVELDRLVRAANPWPMAWTQLGEGTLRVVYSEPSEIELRAEPGTARRHGHQIVVSCGDGVLELVRVQPPGKPAMDAQSWWNGLRTDQVVLT